MGETQGDEDHRLFLPLAGPAMVQFLRMAAAISLAGRPAQEKIGSFWPLTRVLRPSMAEKPVSMNSSGRARLVGLIGSPVIRRPLFGQRGGSPSDGQEGAVEDPVQHMRRQGRLLDLDR